MEAVNPATGERIAEYTEDDNADLEAKLATATDRFEDWRNRPMREREELIASAADVLRENKREYAELMTNEMGKPISPGARRSREVRVGLRPLRGTRERLPRSRRTSSPRELR